MYMLPHALHQKCRYVGTAHCANRHFSDNTDTRECNIANFTFDCSLRALDT